MRKEGAKESIEDREHAARMEFIDCLDRMWSLYVGAVVRQDDRTEEFLTLKEKAHGMLSRISNGGG